MQWCFACLHVWKFSLEVQFTSMAIFSRVFLASGLRNRPSRQDGSWPSSKEEPQRAQARARDRRPQSKTFLPDWIPEMSNVMDIGAVFVSKYWQQRTKMDTNHKSFYRFFIDKVKYSKVSITSLSLYSVLTKSPKFLPPRVPRALQDIFLIQNFPRWPWTISANTIFISKIKHLYSKVTVDELCKRWKTSVEHGLTDAQACKWFLDW